MNRVSADGVECTSLSYGGRSGWTSNFLPAALKRDFNLKFEFESVVTLSLKFELILTFTQRVLRQLQNL